MRPTLASPLTGPVSAGLRHRGRGRWPHPLNRSWRRRRAPSWPRPNRGRPACLSHRHTGGWSSGRGHLVGIGRHAPSTALLAQVQGPVRPCTRSPSGTPRPRPTGSNLCPPDFAVAPHQPAPGFSARWRRTRDARGGRGDRRPSRFTGLCVCLIVGSGPRRARAILRIPRAPDRPPRSTVQAIGPERIFEECGAPERIRSARAQSVENAGLFPTTRSSDVAYFCDTATDKFLPPPGGRIGTRRPAQRRYSSAM
jgi:hypothetical protein